MKKLLIVFFVTMVFSACANREASQERQDSLNAAAAADSMLKEAAENDTNAVDKVAVDTSGTDGL